MKEKVSKRIVAVWMLVSVLVTSLLVPDLATAAEVGSNEEFVHKGMTTEGDADPMDVYWVDASVQKPDNYTDIIGFKLTVKMNEIGYYADATFPLGIILATKGAHEASEYAFTYPENFPEYDLASSEITAMAVGESSYLGPMAFKTGINADTDMNVGDTRTLEYSGTTALFTEDDSIMTIVSFEGKFDYESIEWITGDPEELEEEPWEKVDTNEYLDIPTVDDGIQNGYNYVDITVPDTGEESYPVVLWIHGGGWQSFTRKNCIMSDTKDYLLAKGYAFVSAEYTLSVQNDDGVIENGAGIQMLYDIKAAVRFIRAHAEEYNLDTRFIAAIGESAGGHLSLTMGTTNGDAQHEDLSMGNEDFSSDVQAMVSYFGPTDLTPNPDDSEEMAASKDMMAYAIYGENAASMTEEEIDLLSPVEWINSDSPAMYLTHGHNDETVPSFNSEEILEAAQVYMDEEDIASVFYEDAPHGSRKPFDSYTAYVTVTNFLDTHKAEFISDDVEVNSEDNEVAAIEDSANTENEPTNTAENTTNGLPIGMIVVVAFMAVGVIVVVVFISRKKKS